MDYDHVIVGCLGTTHDRLGWPAAMIRSAS
jgi:hypothetical protein